MAHSNELNWEERDFVWEDPNNLNWDDKYLLEHVFNVATDGGQLTTRKKVQKTIDELPKKDHDRLITILFKLKEHEYTETKKINTDIKLTIEDLKFILKEGIKVHIKIID